MRLDAGASEENGQRLSDALFFGSRPRRGTHCVRQSIWCELVCAWPPSCGSLCDLARAGRRRTVSPRPTHSLVAVFPETGGPVPGKTRGPRAGGGGGGEN